ncbi:DMT family transporter [Azohydromonas aeria]|uniref:DMT family transporter n=1 Tax=Azohydromonas aeria TaxID=2590212 RepID=UPI0012F81BA6|nr:SMR family transporter [Azohydromonas aeria]
MKPATFALIISGVLLNAAAQLFLKAGTRQLGVIQLNGGPNPMQLALDIGTQPWIVGGLCCYVVSLVLWIAALSRVDVMVAYPMLSIGYVVNAFIAWRFLGEAITPMRLLGIAVIMIGVIILSRG